MGGIKNKMPDRRGKQLCISKVPFFNHLANHEMFEIVKKGRSITFQKGEFIYQEGEPLEYLYIVHKGRVKIYQLFESGKEQLLRILETGEFMGELALFSEKMLDSYAEAMEKTEICAIHRKDMQELMQTYPTIAIKILEQFSNRLDQTEKLVGQLSTKDVETRLAGYLVELAQQKNSMDIMLPMSKKDLASYLGTTQETISRRLSSFQTNSWIAQTGHRRIKITDIDALTDCAANI
ncbi:cyclic nucleotide-binding domain-containing protein [Virgibacillus dakarensis]|nr:cyclic nucleotide-binding domain-containing protein [Virgibacillus dakarensis]